MINYTNLNCVAKFYFAGEGVSLSICGRLKTA